MINRLLLCAFLITLATGCKMRRTSSVVSGGPTTEATIMGEVTVATWNLQWYPGKKAGDVPADDKDAHEAAVIDVLKDIDAGIICLQEVRQDDAQGALDRLCKATGHRLQVVSAFDGAQEIAILSRYQASAAFMEEFTATASRESTPPRGFAFAAFPLEGFKDAVLGVYSVHLKSNYGGPAETAPKREESARQLVAHADKMAAQYGTGFIAVIAGDLNVDPTRDDWKDEQTIPILTDAGFRWTGDGVPREDAVTWLSDGRYPDAVFDHILVRGSAVFSVSDVEVMPTDREVSDHRPAMVRIKVTGTKE